MRTFLFLAAASFATLGQAADPIERGRELFTKQWQPQTPSRTQGDGLGPYFNERSCAGCHKLGGVGGAGPSENNVQLIVTANLPLWREKDPAEFFERMFPFAVNGVMVLHRRSTLAGYDAVRLKRLQYAAPQHPEVAMLPRMDPPQEHRGVLFCGNGRSAPLVPYEERNTSALFGSGQVDAVSQATLEAVAAAQPEVVRGRLARLPGGEVGRFGWKGQNATLLDFCENACAVELGLETPRRRQAGNAFVRRAPNVPSPGGLGPRVSDMTTTEVIELTRFVGSLPVPRRATPADARDEDVAIGEFIFTGIGCAECHVPNLGEIRGIYSDLLLHRVGTSGSVYYEFQTRPADVIDANQIVPPAADEFRTPPLWGVADSAPYMHDGGAKTLREAILAHGVQGDESNRIFRALPPDDQLRVLAFLESLRAPLPVR